MPIKNLSDAERIPRLGKIHLGIRNAQKGYPQKTDYFVFPKEHSDYDNLVKVFGEKPKELRILIPVEDDEEWAAQYYKSYNQTYGLVCKGDGETAMRLVDTATNDIVTVTAPGITVRLQDQACAGPECPVYKLKKCHEVMNFKFIIPEVPGLGVWQIDTGSKNSILNINSCARIIKRMFGRITLIPLKLTIEPIQVNNPEDKKKQTVYVLNLRTDITVAQLADQAREQAKVFQLEAPDLEAVAEVQLEEGVDTLFGEKKQEPPSTPEKQQPDVTKAESKGTVKEEAKQPKKEAGKITSIEQLARELKADFGLSYQDQYNELNIKNWNELKISYDEAYQQIASTHGKKEN